MLILGIESSCDETGAAIVRDGRTVIANALASQADLHARYGGVVPEVAARQQVAAIIPVIETAMAEAGIGWRDIDAVAATHGPGLAGPLLVGLTAAKTIAMARNIPFLGINHLEAHIYANWLQQPCESFPEPQFPLLALLVSGAHSELIILRDHGQYEMLGHTRDDAAGEAFDKVARLIGLRYPGGPSIQQAAAQLPANQQRTLELPRAWIRGTYDFSFSGIKTAVMHLVREAEAHGDPVDAVAIASAFQESVVDVLATKTVQAAREQHAASVVLAGGVAANVALRQRLQRDLGRHKIPFRYPPVAWCTDNAAMIAGTAYYHFIKGDRSSLSLDVDPQLSLPLV